jgi:hypothetical protein
MIDHVVIPGDCMLTIAEEYGFYWETLWDLPENAELKQLRKDPNVLEPGDIVKIPIGELKEVAKSDGAKHRFRKKSNLAKVRIQVLDYEHRPRKNLKYLAVLDGEALSGTTDGQGYAEIAAPPGAQQLRLEVEEDGETEVYEFQLGHVDPVESIRGVRQRLANLGFACETSGEMDAPLREVLKDFQRRHKLPETGELDAATRQKIKSVHGC